MKEHEGSGSNQNQPPNDGPGGNDPLDDDHDDHDRRSIEGEEEDGTVDLTNTYLLQILTRAVRNAGYTFTNPLNNPANMGNQALRAENEVIRTILQNEIQTE